MVFIGIDNGVTGAIGMLSTEATLHKMPVRRFRDFQKKEQYLNRINVKALLELFKDVKDDYVITLERPMINPRRFTSSVSALRAWEATLVALDLLGLSYDVLDSKEWQKYFQLTGDLKEASKSLAIKLFPNCEAAILKQKDGDALLIAEYKRRTKT
jgi:hypothetical protein